MAQRLPLKKAPATLPHPKQTTPRYPFHAVPLDQRLAPLASSKGHVVRSFVTSWSSSYTRWCASCQRKSQQEWKKTNVKKTNFKCVCFFVLFYILCFRIWGSISFRELIQRQSDVIQHAQLLVSVKCTTLLVFGALRFSHLQVHFRLSQIHLQLLLLFLQALQFGAEFCAPVRGTKVKIKLVKILMKIACKYLSFLHSIFWREGEFFVLKAFQWKCAISEWSPPHVREADADPLVRLEALLAAMPGPIPAESLGWMPLLPPEQMAGARLQCEMNFSSSGISCKASRLPNKILSQEDMQRR